LGADGIVGIDFHYEVLGENNGMMMVSVSGTAVKMGPGKVTLGIPIPGSGSPWSGNVAAPRRVCGAPLCEGGSWAVPRNAAWTNLVPSRATSWGAAHDSPMAPLGRRSRLLR
jgi:hypothetical protein